MDREQFGAFITERRKALNMTQKDLSERLRLSDKAISKWERGLSYPDITLLEPLSFILDVSIVELIEGRQMNTEEMIEKKEVDEMLQKTMELNNEEREQTARMIGKERIWTTVGFITASLLECLFLFFMDVDIELLSIHLFTVVGLAYFFGVYFWIFAKDKLPEYYDKSKVNIYSDGAFRMNMPGVYFNNHNWRHIVSALRVWTLLVSVLYPVLALFIDRLFKMLDMSGMSIFLLLPVMFAVIFSFFIPLYRTAKRYE